MTQQADEDRSIFVLAGHAADGHIEALLGTCIVRNLQTPGYLHYVVEVCLPACLSVCLYVCMFVCLFVYLTFAMADR